jgi:hypothetical protein
MTTLTRGEENKDLHACALVNYFPFYLRMQLCKSATTNAKFTFVHLFFSHTLVFGAALHTANKREEMEYLIRYLVSETGGTSPTSVFTV